MSNQEANRYEAFCQFHTMVRGRRDYLLVVIDVAKERHHAFFGTATGKTLLKPSTTAHPNILGFH